LYQITAASKPLTKGLPPPDPRSLCLLPSTEFVEPPHEQNFWVRHWVYLLLISVYFFLIRLVLTYFQTVHTKFGLIRIISRNVSAHECVCYQLILLVNTHNIITPTCFDYSYLSSSGCSITGRNYVVLKHTVVWSSLTMIDTSSHNMSE